MSLCGCASSGREDEGGQQRRNVSHIFSSPPPLELINLNMSVYQADIL